ncbi:MAG TPA: hypothetical protein VFZ21_20245 [Gemmatimonadaceae bacterium]|nr:hypothetical protein [Gemmatimonadaceae bacterium]
MRVGAAAVRAVGLAAMLSLGAATALAQVDTAKARIPVRKEQPTVPTKAPATPVTQEPSAVPAPTDPAAVMRPDTARRVSAGEVVAKDSVPAVTPAQCAMMPTNRAMRPGVRTEPCGAMMPQHQAQPTARASRSYFGKSGFYFGAGAGTAVPFNQLSNLGYDSGIDLTIPVGWQRPGRTLGIRALLAYDQVHADLASVDRTAPAMLGSAPDPKIYSAALDATLSFPIGRAAREGRGFTLYTLGGGGVYLFRGFGGTTVLADVLGGDEVGTSPKNVHKWGIQAGAGMQYGLGPTAVFFESRWVNVFTSGSKTGNDYLRWIPVSVGVIVR